MNRSRRKLVAAAAIVAIFFAARSASGQTPTPPTIIQAKFAVSVNSKSAWAGDVIVAKTIAPSVLKDGTELPTGSRLIGKLTTAESKGEGGGTSTLAIKFDHVEVKGELHPFQGQIVAISVDPAFQQDTGNAGLLSRGGGDSLNSHGETPGISLSGHADQRVYYGSQIKGVSLDQELDENGASVIRGLMKDFKLESTTFIKVVLR
jgi:hypothetical protein